MLIGSLINARITPSVIRVSKGKRLLELAFPLSPDIEARLEPNRELLVTHSKFLVYRKSEIALTRAGLGHLGENFTAYYYREGVKGLSRQQRAALSDPQGPSVQLPLSHNAAKKGLRKEIRRLSKGKHLSWREMDGDQILTAPVNQVDANRLHTQGAYWRQLALAVERDGLLVIRPKALIGLPEPALATLPPRPEPKPKPKRKAPAARKTTTPTPEPRQPELEAAPATKSEEAPRGNDPRAAAQRLSEAPPFPDLPSPQASRNEAPPSVAEWAPPMEDDPSFGGDEAPEQLGDPVSATPPGLKPKPDFVQQNAAVIVRHGEKSSADTVLLAKGFNRAKVHEWVEENKDGLVGHPAAPESLERPNALGRYAGPRLLIPYEAVLERLQYSNVSEVPGHFKRVTHRIEGEERDWILLDPAAASGSEEMILITAIESGDETIVDSMLRLEELLELPLDEAMKLMGGVDWGNTQAVQYGSRAWVNVYVVDTTIPQPTAPAPSNLLVA